jgi:hypothetical protein
MDPTLIHNRILVIAHNNYCISRKGLGVYEVTLKVGWASASGRDDVVEQCTFEAVRRYWKLAFHYPA